MTTAIHLPIEGELPSLAGATGWLNSKPLTPEALRGRPVLVVFWTFTCINSIRTLPRVRAWHEKYLGDGLTVLGVHTPEFEVERGVEQVRRAAEEMRIDYPIAMDSDYAIWRAFANQYWPALYFGDADGQVRHHRFGEGEYEYSEIIIQLLLKAAGASNVSRELARVDARGVEAPADWDNLRSSETYIGYVRAENFASPDPRARDRPQQYTPPDAIQPNHWALAGDWTIRRQAAILNASGVRSRIASTPATSTWSWRRHAPTSMSAIASASTARSPEQPTGSTSTTEAKAVTEPRLYQLIRQPGPITDRTFEITFLDRGIHTYVFTFG